MNMHLTGEDEGRCGGLVKACRANSTPPLPARTAIDASSLPSLRAASSRVRSSYSPSQLPPFLPLDLVKLLAPSG